MPEQQLRKEIARLHEELESASRVDAPSRELLERLLADIRRLLETSSDPSPEEEDDSLGERLGDAVRHFEETHPNLALAVGRIATALSNLGI